MPAMGSPGRNEDSLSPLTCPAFRIPHTPYSHVDEVGSSCDGGSNMSMVQNSLWPHDPGTPFISTTTLSIPSSIFSRLICFDVGHPRQSVLIPTKYNPSWFGY